MRSHRNLGQTMDADTLGSARQPLFYDSKRGQKKVSMTNSPNFGGPRADSLEDLPPAGHSTDYINNRDYKAKGFMVPLRSKSCNAQFRYMAFQSKLNLF